MAEAGTSAAMERSRRRNSRDWLIDFRLVLVGKTGAGKSSSGNTILGRDAFGAAVSQSSVTQHCCKQSGDVFDKHVSIVDTPGLFDTSLPERTVKREISKCINMSAPGPHAILLVIKVGPFSSEERDAVRQVEEIFGEDAWRFTIVLFAQSDHSGPATEQQLQEAGPELQSVLEKAGNRFHVLNNQKTNDRGQVLHLLEKVEEMLKVNGGQFYSNYTYVQVVEMLDKREAELRKFYEKKLEEQKASVESKYKEMLSEAESDHEKAARCLQAELTEVTRYYRVLESGARHVLEQTVEGDSMDEIFKFHTELKLKFTS